MAGLIVAYGLPYINTRHHVLGHSALCANELLHEIIELMESITELAGRCLSSFKWLHGTIPKSAINMYMRETAHTINMDIDTLALISCSL